MTRVILALAIHNHQPVGNFPHVFEAAYRQSYLPMIAALERHPAIAMALHYSGPLLDWLEEAHPEFFPRLAALVARGQVELMTGGYYEPVLAIIPDRDKRGQIRKMTAYLRRRFGVRPRGLWLAERVWEPHLAKAIALAGAAYTVLDDAHFLAAGLRERDLTGYFVTEEDGIVLNVFPSLRRLRYLIPWRPPSEAVDDLRRAAGRGTVVLGMGDDGEKFGMWPETYAHCWEQGWVDAFFLALAAEASWLTVMAPGTVAAEWPAAGRVYLPTASYDEMTEWALPAARAGEFAEIRHRLAKSSDPAVDYLRGGYWRQFLVKYPEVNTMHKTMLRVSKKVWAMPPGPRRARALDELWQGQCNCPYWHGIFGGAYLPHIRRANFAHLIAADSLAGVPRGVRIEAVDLDGDGTEEVEVASRTMVLTVAPRLGGAVIEWDWRKQRINLVNVLTRRPEAYHRRLLEEPHSAGESAATVETIHTERVRVTEPGLERLLIYDRYRRASFLDHLIDPYVTLEAFSRGEYEELADLIDAPYSVTLKPAGRGTVTLVCEGTARAGWGRVPLRVEKSLAVDDRRSRLTVGYRIETQADQEITALFGVETNWAITDPHTPVRVGSDVRPARETRARDAARRIEFADTGWDGTVRQEVSAARVWLLPLETVSNSEAGFERVFQGVTCLCAWPVTLQPGRPWQTTLIFSLAPA